MRQRSNPKTQNSNVMRSEQDSLACALALKGWKLYPFLRRLAYAKEIAEAQAGDFRQSDAFLRDRITSRLAHAVDSPYDYGVSSDEVFKHLGSVNGSLHLPSEVRQEAIEKVQANRLEIAKRAPRFLETVS